MAEKTNAERLAEKVVGDFLRENLPWPHNLQEYKIYAVSVSYEISEISGLTLKWTAFVKTTLPHSWIFEVSCDCPTNKIQFSRYTETDNHILPDMSVGDLPKAVKYCALDFEKAHASYHPWCTDHDLPAIHRNRDQNHQVCQEFAKKHGCGCHGDYYKEN